MQWFDMTMFWILAEVDDAAPANGAPESGLFGNFPMIIVMLVVLFYFMIIRPETRKKKKQQAELESLKKNDRVVTIGGIYGSVVSVNREADEIVLKVDESSGAKIRISVTAVSRLITDKDDTDSKQSGK